MQQMPMILTSSMRDDQLTALTLALIKDAHEIGIEVKQKEVVGSPGERGASVSVGELLMVFISSGAAVALIGCLRAYISRYRTLKVKIKKADGSEINIDASNIDMKSTVDAVRALAES